MRSVAAERVEPQVRALAAAAAPELAATVRDADDPRVRAYALARLVEGDPPELVATWRAALADPAAAVRRRAAELAPRFAAPAGPLVPLLGDADVTVIEAAAWALGELGDAETAPALARVTTEHEEPLAREAAVAALGALGAEAGRAAVLHACTDVATVRRRAVLALAAFDGDDVDRALEAARTDRDWQTRQAAEDLLTPVEPDDLPE